jgi:hypothetical protein
MLGGGGPGAFRSLATILQNHLVQGNANRANFGAISAKGGCLAKVLVGFKGQQVRGDDFANGAGIGGPVTMTADVFVNRTSIEASTASDAMQGLPSFGIFEQSGSAVVQEDHHHFLGTVAFVVLAWSVENSVISRHLLTRSFGSQQRPQKVEVVHRRKYFFDASHNDMGLGKGR